MAKWPKKAIAKIVPVDGMAQALALVQQGRADFTFNDSLALLDYLKKNPNSACKRLGLRLPMKSVAVYCEQRQ